MTLLAVASAYYRTQQALVRLVVDLLVQLWAELDPDNLSGSWTSSNLRDRAFLTLARGQLASVEVAERYVIAALAEQSGDPESAGVLVGRAFSGVASDGRDLDTLLLEPLITTKTAIGNGRTPADALRVGQGALRRIGATQVADTGRSATATAIQVRPAVTGWVRMLNLPSCGRCAVLAGRRYRHSAGFDRHPLCDCVHVPSVEDAADDIRTDPDAYFASLSPEDQDRYFTAAGAESIRSGADIGQVVNARRGASGLSQPGRLTAAEQAMLRGGRGRGQLERVDVYGRKLAVTSEGVTVRGAAGRQLARESGTVRRPGQRYRAAKTPRLMPEAIIELAGDDRDEAVRLLRRFGYIA